MNKRAESRNKILSLSAISIALFSVLFFSGLLTPFENKAFDLMSRNLNPSSTVEDIVIVKVDQESIDALSPEGVNWPWPRQMYAPMVEQMAGADAIIIDILFTEPSSYGVEDDLIFADAIEKAGNVYLPVFLTNNGRPQPEDAPYSHTWITSGGDLPAPLEFRNAVMPIDVLGKAVKAIGNVTIPPDRDGVYRRVPLLFGLNDTYVPHLVMSRLLDSGKAGVSGRGISIDNTPVPLRDGHLLLRYYPEDHPFPEISAVEVLRSYLSSESGGEPEISRDYFNRKTVFIGLTAAGLYDLKPTSVSSVSTGVIIHATTFENLRDSNFIVHMGPAWTFLLALAVVVFITYIVIRHHRISVTISMLAVTAGAVVLTISALFAGGLYMDMIAPVLALALGFMVSTAYSYAVEGKERRFVRRTFSQYMDEKLVKHLLENPDFIKPGGQKRYVTIFFIDIAGFTSLAEKLSPSDISMILNKVFNEFTEVIIRNNGVIDKYIGDCIMAFWGSPLSSDEDESNACRAALECIKSLSGINEGFRRQGLDSIEVRVGIHSGEVIAGNLGSNRLFDYTVVGDSVNLASRLEGANKLFGTRIIVSRETLSKTGGAFLARPLGAIEVKGKSLPASIYELMGPAGGEATKENIALEARFSAALGIYNEKKFAEASRAFGEILKSSPDDGPSAYYRARADELANTNSLTQGWDVIKMTSK